MSAKKQKLWPTSLIAIASIIITLALEFGGTLNRIEYMTYDWRTVFSRAESKAPDDIAVVLIDDASLNIMNPLVGRWPWPRSLHADIIDFIALGEPKAIVFDILFTEKEMSDNNLAISSNDQRLAESTAGAGMVTHAMQIHRDNDDERDHNNLNKALPGNIHAQGFKYDNIEIKQKNNLYYLPIKIISDNSNRLGVVSTEPDADGIYRKTKLFHEYQGRLYPSLGTAPLIENNTAIQTDKNRITIDNTTLTIDSDGNFLINHYEKINTYSISGLIASAQQIMEGEMEGLIVDPFEFKDKLVFIGASAVGLEDLKATPLSATTPGVMLHAATAGNIISGEILKPIAALYNILLLSVMAILISFFILYQNKFVIQIAIPAILITLYITVCFYAFEHLYVLNMSSPLFSAATAATICFTYLLFTEGRDKRRVRKMLSQYVSPAVLNTVADKYHDQLQAEVGSEECLSILFSDIRGFTNLSEAVPADKVVAMLNHYFSAMTEAIFDHRGTIDKFIGDAIMAFWGAPIREKNYADLSVQAAIEMIRRLDGVNQWLTEHNYPAIQIGIGINSGNVILGNIGSTQKLDYTIIGDNVNLASRLEGLTKQYGCALIISEYTHNLLKEPMPCHLLDLVRVKGKQVPIRIYEPIFNLPEDEAKKLEQLSHQAFAAYLQQDWHKAIELYSKLPVSTQTSTFIERCKVYRETPPPPDWDGVFTMTTK